MTKINPQWAEYNRLHNEGGEGYNPYPQYLDQSGEPMWSILEGRASKARRILNGTSPSDFFYAKLKAECDAAQTAYAAEFAAARARGEV